MSLSSLKADPVSAPGYGFGCVDGQPLGGRPALSGGPVQDVALLSSRSRYIPGVTDYSAVIASSAGAGSVEGLGALGVPMPTKWWHWALLAGVGYLAWKQFGK